MNQNKLFNEKLVKKLERFDSIVNTMDDRIDIQMSLTQVYKRYLQYTRNEIRGFYRLFGMSNDQHVQDYRKFTIKKTYDDVKRKREISDD